jgi:uncharacterized membrane protein YfcA
VSLVAALLIAAIGVLVGAVGLGGFLLVPVLVLLDGRAPHEALAAATLAFAAAGVLSWVTARPADGAGAGTDRPAAAQVRWAFLLAAMPGAAIGAFAVGSLAQGPLALLIAAAFALAGWAEWQGWPRDARRRAAPEQPAAWAAGGLGTGLASALTGTGGPLVGLPLLSWAGLAGAERLALAKGLQLPVAVGAGVVYAGAATLPWATGAACAAALCAGAAFGGRLARALPPATLRRLSAVLMWAGALAMALKSGS